jgi:hypothetical protein
VTAWLWINPHVLLKVAVKDDKGNVTNWTAEFVAPSNMIRTRLVPFLQLAD